MLPDATGRNPLYLLRPYKYIDEKRLYSAVPKTLDLDEPDFDDEKLAAPVVTATIVPGFQETSKRQVYVARVGKRIVYAARVG
ncbi:unnamed protein product [Gongylonema pulchrum]|uniref:Uncharacterized protein n=1 Tax=Gongylonema pulchrum TaxID=637853 RepID=A0A3P7NQS3_9BILA|nr:unnamed protein product [Gongylonema pulchrum]